MDENGSDLRRARRHQRRWWQRSVVLVVSVLHRGMDDYRHGEADTG
jgi:hypothetical protein